MKFYYPVILAEKEDGTWHGHFPDLAMCEVHAASLEDALDKAVEAAYAWIDLELLEEDPHLPPATDWADIPLKENEQVREILVNYRFSEGWEE